MPREMPEYTDRRVGAVALSIKTVTEGKKFFTPFEFRVMRPSAGAEFCAVTIQPFMTLSY